MTQRIMVPPIKSQGIKSKLVPWISEILPDFKGNWIEPFMGTGVVGFNLARKAAIMCDTNPHLVDFYSKIKSKGINSDKVRFFLNLEGEKLANGGAKYYYEVRDRFNSYKNPLDFLFINRSCFNGMIRFNKKGEINIPFCHKNNRFSKSYITKICNQIYNLVEKFSHVNFTFCCQSFEDTISEAASDDLVYCDPPYIDRHVDYYNGWNSNNEERLFNLLCKTKSRFILSTWHHNAYRSNIYIDKYWSRFNIITKNHFYHVGAKEKKSQQYGGSADNEL